VTETSWWRTASIYQVYLRSFADGNDDGLGDLAGLRSRLPYLRELGVDALWLNPWYVSPMADGGYDVADYRDIDPMFGTLADAEALIDEAHATGLKLIIDLVPNHCSSAHPWFQAALAATPGSEERERFWFRPGRGAKGELPPNDWQSMFGGPAWTRIDTGEWYLHLFDPGQPDWNWNSPRVRAEFEDVLRFWLDRGVDGFRIDVADMLVKDNRLPDMASWPDPVHPPDRDQEGVHDIYRDWRRILDGYPGDRVFVGEIWTGDPERFALYTRPDELHTAFTFSFLQCRWDAKDMRAVIDRTLTGNATWVLSNHDVTRHVTRYGRKDTGYGQRTFGAPVDLALGTRRARAAALLTMALPGGVYVYQGDELGLPEVEDLPVELRQDPTLLRSGGTDLGRDGCRVPIPWNGEHPPFGFSASADPWLPQPTEWRDRTVAAEQADDQSHLRLYQQALRIRPRLTEKPMEWLPAPDHVLAFTRGGLTCVVNLSGDPVEPPPHKEVLLASGPLTDGLLPPDTAAWLS
jgi:alpha-glucosidase